MTSSYTEKSNGRLATPFSFPVYVMAKPVGASCNLACEYCYYTEKAKLYKDKEIMTDETLELFIRDYIAMQTQREVLFTWHGGEPLLRHIAFYERVMELQHKYADGHVIDNCIQTNGTLIDDRWAQFFHRNGWLVGVSIDGEERFNDAYRHTPSGLPTFQQVMHGIRTLNKHDVEWNGMAVVNDYNADHPKEFYRFFKDIGCRYIQFTPIVERTCHDRLACLVDDAADCRLTRTSVSPEQWGRFLCNVFDEWVEGDIGQYFVQLFESTIANMVGVVPGVCSLCASCGNALVMEYNGDVYSCDHFVFHQYLLGNIHKRPLTEMAYGERQNAFRRLKSDMPRQCRECHWLKLCHGECPKNRFAVTKGGEHNLNYLCKGYQMFFEHATPYMEEIIKRLNLR